MLLLAVAFACSSDPAHHHHQHRDATTTETDPLVPNRPPEEPPEPRAEPTLRGYGDGTPWCGWEPGCANLSDVALMWAGADAVELVDVTGDGVDDLVTQGAVWPVPTEWQDFPLDAIAWWDGYDWGGYPQLAGDYDGDGLPDLHGWYLAPFEGPLDEPQDVVASSTYLEELTGDGILDHWERAAGTGLIEIFAGPFADDATEPWLRVEYAFDRTDPDLAICFWGYGFFDEENTFTVYVGDVLGGPEPEVQIVSDYTICPLARPLLVTEGGTYVVTKEENGGLASGPGMVSTPDIDGDGARDTLAFTDWSPTLHRGARPSTGKRLRSARPSVRPTLWRSTS